MKTRSLRDHAILALKLAVVLGALAWLVGTGRLGLSDLAVPLSKPGWAALGALFTLLPFLITFLRLQKVLHAVGTPMALGPVIRIGFIGAFFNTFMLGGVGGDVVKLAYLARSTGEAARATAAVLLDRVLALLSLLSLGAIALAGSWSHVEASQGLQAVALTVAFLLGSAAWSGVVAVVAMARGRGPALLLFLALAGAVAAVGYLLAGAPPLAGAPVGADELFRARTWMVLALDSILALSALLVAPSFLPGGRMASLVPRLPMGSFLGRFIDAVLMTRRQTGLMGALLLLSMVSQSFSVLAIYSFGRTLPLPPELSQLFAAVPVAMLVNALPVPGGGLGVGEAALAGLLELFTVGGAPVTGGAVIFLAWRVWIVLWGLLGLPVYLQRHGGTLPDLGREDLERHGVTPAPEEAPRRKPGA